MPRLMSLQPSLLAKIRRRVMHRLLLGSACAPRPRRLPASPHEQDESIGGSAHEAACLCTRRRVRRSGQQCGRDDSLSRTTRTQTSRSQLRRISKGKKGSPESSVLANRGRRSPKRRKWLPPWLQELFARFSARGALPGKKEASRVVAGGVGTDETERDGAQRRVIISASRLSSKHRSTAAQREIARVQASRIQGKVVWRHRMRGSISTMVACTVFKFERCRARTEGSAAAGCSRKSSCSVLRSRPQHRTQTRGRREEGRGSGSGAADCSQAPRYKACAHQNGHRTRQRANGAADDASGRAAMIPAPLPRRATKDQRPPGPPTDAAATTKGSEKRVEREPRAVRLLWLWTLRRCRYEHDR